MASELEARITHNFAEDIASKLGDAAIIARTASGTVRRACPSEPSARWSTSRR